MARNMLPVTNLCGRCCFSMSLLLAIFYRQQQAVSGLDSPFAWSITATEKSDGVEPDIIHQSKELLDVESTIRHRRTRKRRRQLLKKYVRRTKVDESTWRYPVLHSKGVLQQAKELEKGNQKDEISRIMTVHNVKDVIQKHHNKYWKILNDYFTRLEPNTSNGGSGPALQFALSALQRRQQLEGEDGVRPITHRDFTILPEGELIVWKGKVPNTLIYSAYDGNRSMIMDREKDRNAVTFVPPEVGAAWTDEGYHESNIENDGPKYETDYMSKVDKITELEGDHVYWGIYFQGVFAHIMLDYIAYFSYLKDHLPANAKMLILDSGGREGNNVRSMFEEIDPEFVRERITFVPCAGHDSGPVKNMHAHYKFHYMNRHGIMCYDQLLRVKNGNLIVMHPTTFHRHMDYILSARRWIASASHRNGEVELPPRKRNKVIFHTRTPLHVLEEALNADDPLKVAKQLQSSVNPKESGVSNGRLMDLELEVMLVKTVKRTMRRLQFQRRRETATNTSRGEPLELVLFDGKMPFHDTIELFQSANIVIGPHGGGMANTLLLLDGDEENKVKVLEFVTSPLTPELQEGGIARSYFYMFNTAPWIDEYHHIFYVPPSSDWGRTYVNTQDFNDALSSIFQTTNKAVQQ